MLLSKDRMGLEHFTIAVDSIGAGPPRMPNFVQLQLHGRVRAELNGSCMGYKEGAP